MIFDRLRRKFVALQPEEWVRQNMIEFLVTEKHYPPTLVGNEISLSYNGLQRRCDSVVYSRTGTALMIIEYKAPTIEITRRTFDQIALYNSQLQVRYLLLSNGFTHFCCKINPADNSLRFLEEIPYYEDLE
jgi:hypothetical protein